MKLKSVVDHFISNTLDRIAAGAKEAAKGATGDAIGNATAAGHGAPVLLPRTLGSH
nr:hypothetical protein [Borrelia turicatae]